MLAAAEGHEEIVKEFMHNSDLRSSVADKELYASVIGAEYKDNNAFMLAAVGDKFAVVREILESRETLGDDLYYRIITARDSQGHNAFALAAMDGCVAVLREVRNFARTVQDGRLYDELIMAKDINGYDASMLAVNAEAVELVKQATHDRYGEHSDFKVS